MRRFLAALVAVLMFAPGSDAGWPNSGRVYPSTQVAASVNFLTGGTGVACASFAACFASSRTSGATMVDSTGAVTFAPNNLIANSNAPLSWVNLVQSATVVTQNAATNAVTGNPAASFVFTGGGYYYDVPTSPVAMLNGQYALCGWLWSPSSTGTTALRIAFTGGGAAQKIVTLSATPQHVCAVGVGANGNSIQTGLDNRTLVGADGVSKTVYASEFTLSQITYETPPRAVDQVITGASPYYGPRFDYTGGSLVGLLEEPASTNLFLNSGSPATQTIAVSNSTAYAVGMYGAGSSNTDTLSGALSATLTGAGTSTRVSYSGTTSTTSLVNTLANAGGITYPQVEAGAYPTSPIVTGGSATGRAVDVPAAAGPLAAALAAGPSMWELRDEQTGVVSRAAYAAGAFPFPVGKWYRLACAYRSGVSLSYATARAARPNGSGC